MAKAVASVGPGATVVLRSGVYGARGTTNYMKKAGTADAPITYRGFPGEPMPAILGFFKITASHQRFNYMLFDGPTGPAKVPTADNPNGEQVQISVIGSGIDGVEISNSEIRNSDWHAGIFLSGVKNVRIVGNYIHDNGNEADPGQVNQSHGIYWSSGSGLITNNVIEHNLARGIQLYQGPSDVTISNNTVVRNGRAGIQFANATTNSIAVNNVVALNEYGIRSSSLAGTGNVVQNNLVWGNTRGDLTLVDGLSLVDNFSADPLISAGNYRLQTGSPGIDRALPGKAPASDFAGAARPQGPAPDVGAYEGSAAATTDRLVLPPAPPPPTAAPAPAPAPAAPAPATSTPPAPTTAKAPVATRQQPVRVSVSTGSRRGPRVTVSGTVKGRETGTVVATALYARGKGRYRRVGTRKVPVRDGRFKASVARFRHGRWRVKAVLKDTPTAVAGRTFRLEPGGGAQAPPGINDDGRRALEAEEGSGSEAAQPAQQLYGEGRFTEPEPPGPLAGGGYVGMGFDAPKGTLESVEDLLTSAGFESSRGGGFERADEAAVLRFQKAHGLLVDGVVGRQTMTALKQYAAGA